MILLRKLREGKEVVRHCDIIRKGKREREKYRKRESVCESVREVMLRHVHYFICHAVCLGARRSHSSVFFVIMASA